MVKKKTKKNFKVIVPRVDINFNKMKTRGLKDMKNPTILK